MTTDLSMCCHIIEPLPDHEKLVFDSFVSCSFDKILKSINKSPPSLNEIINMLQHSHIPVNTKSTQTLIQVAKRNQVGFPLVCSCVVGLASVGSRHGSNQVKACLPTEFKGRENKQKDERNWRILMDRGRNKVISGCLFEHHTGEKKVTVGFQGGE